MEVWAPGAAAIAAAATAAVVVTSAVAAPTGQAQPGAHAPRTKAPARAKAAPRSDASYRGRADVRRFAEDLARRRELPVSWVLAQLDRARRIPAVQRLIMPPPVGTAKNWAAYRDRFVEPQRIGAGLAFWRAHEPVLARAEAEYGVPADIVVGIIGVETFYGRITGEFRVLDALATLAFDFPPGRRDRSEFFRGELEELLIWTHREGRDANQPRGSYAGAMGLPQFMPGSLNRHAVDFDGDGRIDLLGSPADAIGSVAHYLAAHGWQRGVPTHFGVRPPADDAERARLLGPDIVPTFSAAQFGERGATLADGGATHDGPLALVELLNGNAAPSFVAGTLNFYAITRYNWSSYYAMAVISLAEAVRQARRPDGG